MKKLRKIIPLLTLLGAYNASAGSITQLATTNGVPANTAGGAYSPLPDIVYTETAGGNVNVTGSETLTLHAPTGFEWDNVGANRPYILLNGNLTQANKNINGVANGGTITNASVSATAITFTFSSKSQSANVLTFRNLRVRPLTAAAFTGTITNSYTSTINGVTAGTTSWGAVTSVKVDQTITFGALPAKTYGDADFNISALGSASSGLVESYEIASGTAATVDAAGNVHIVSAGTVTIRALQAGNTAYNAAPSQTQDLVIAKASANIVVTGYSGPYDAAPHGASGTATGVFAENLNGLLHVTGAFTDVPGGLASWNFDGNGNYAATSGNAPVTITQIPLTVNANPQSKTYGDADPSLTYGIGAGALAGADSLTLTRAPGENIGSYAITIGSFPAAGNYALTFNGANLVIGKRPLTITAEAKSKTYGGADPSLTYTHSTLVGGDSITGTLTRVAGENAGSYQIEQNDVTAGNNYDTTYVPANLTIGKATLTVTAEDKSRVYGQANPTFTASYTGFVNSEDLASSGVTGDPELTTDADETSAVGSTYVITAAVGTLTAQNYAFDFVNGTLTITKATLTVTAEDKSKVYGDANPSLTYTITGFVDGDDESLVTGTPALSTADANSGAGTYPITVDVSGLTADNYSIVAADGTLTVNKATLTVTANDKSKVYGEANPSLTYSITGFVLGDDETVITGTPGLSTADANSGAGTYPITVDVSGLTADNYSFAAADGTLTVNQATLTVTANDQSKVYGEANPSLTYGITGFVLGDDETVITGTPVVSTADANSGAGTYPITVDVSGLTAANYSFAAGVDGTLTVAKAVLGVTADDKSKVAGAANPTLTASFSGFVNGENLGSSGVTGSPALSTTATISSPGGTYAITAALGTLTSANYTFDFVAGTLTVNNTAPIARNNSVGRSAGLDVKVPFFKLLGNDTDADGHTLQIISVTSPTGTGATVSIVGTTIVYTPFDENSNTTDSFSYTISDGFGGQASATVTVSVSIPDDAQSKNFIGLTIDGDDILVRFSGIGGFNYEVQFKAQITDPTWTTLGPVTATPNGQIVYRHVGAALQPAGFYRTISQ